MNTNRNSDAQSNRDKKPIALNLDALIHALTNLREESTAAAQHLHTLQDEQGKIQALLNAMNDEIWFCDVEGDLIYANAAAQQWFNRDAASFKQWLAETTVCTADGQPRDLEETPILRSLEGEIVRSEIEILWHPVTGEVFFREVNSISVVDASGQIIGAVANIRDVTRRYKADMQTQVLHDLIVTLSTQRSVIETAETILQQAVQVFSGNSGFVLLFRGDDGFEVLAHSGLPEHLLEGQHYTGNPQHFPTMQAALSGDPLWLESKEAYEAQFPEFYRAVARETGAQAILGLPMKLADEVIGSIGVTFQQPTLFTKEDRLFYQIVADYCAQAIHRAQLHEQAHAASLTQQKKKFSRDLHDTVSQSLYTVSLMAETLMIQAADFANKSHLERLLRLSRGAHAQLRNLLLEMRPEHLETTPLPDILRQLAEATMGNSLVAIDVRVMHSIPPLPTDMQTSLYYITREALNNVVKHANAEHVEIVLEQQENLVMLSIKDDGQGFDPNKVKRGIGTESMHERAAVIGAELKIESKSGEGTKVTVQVEI